MPKRKSLTSKEVPIQVERWMDQARHDLETARKTFEMRIYDVALVSCEQALEKALKALYIKRTHEMPPQVHSIERLAKETQLEAKLDKALDKLEDFYIQMRYPEPAGPMPYELATLKEAKEAIQLTAAALRLIDREIENASK
jgi:HEPN domain-containing protein